MMAKVLILVDVRLGIFFVLGWGLEPCGCGMLWLIVGFRLCR